MGVARPHLVDDQEGGGIRLFLRRLLDASAHGDGQRAEPHALIDRRIEFRNTRRRLVEPLQHGDRVSMRSERRDDKRACDCQALQEQPAPFDKLRVKNISWGIPYWKMPS